MSITGPPKTVVIVGGGLASRYIVKNLLKRRALLNIVVVQANRFLEFTWAIPSLVCDPSDAPSCTAADPSTFEAKSVQYVYGVATSVPTPTTLEVAPLVGGAVFTIDFDFLVCATGFSLPALLPALGQTLSDRTAYLSKLHAAVKGASSILIAGGGPIAVELAGLLASTAVLAPGATVTLVASSTDVLPDQPSFSARAQAELERLGVKVLLNERVVVTDDDGAREEAGASYTLQKSGDTISADVFIPAFSGGPRTEWLRDGAFAAALDAATGKVAVDPSTLRCAAAPQLFAIGAPSTAARWSALAHIDHEAIVVAANLATLARAPATADAALKKFKGPPMDGIGYGVVSTEYAFFNDGAGGPLRAMKMCGFPCNLLCPCFCCMLCAMPGCNPWVCGACGGTPEGKGTAQFLGATMKGRGIKKRLLAGAGDPPPASQTMEAR